MLIRVRIIINLFMLLCAKTFVFSIKKTGKKSILFNSVVVTLWNIWIERNIIESSRGWKNISLRFWKISKLFQAIRQSHLFKDCSVALLFLIFMILFNCIDVWVFVGVSSIPCFCLLLASYTILVYIINVEDDGAMNMFI